MDHEEIQARFGVTRPDEAAECWDGVSKDLYRALWDCVPLYKSPSPEESEEPCVGDDSIADFWDRFTPEQQQELIRLDSEMHPESALEVDHQVDHHYHRLGHD